ncbi:hypothetical protein EW146_g7934 [Bondarzewia mesenterica]|uniref:Uncharacterized protein n=1 Tax=Bondarzewia mesenterica TaxID=1095465 RepID=A0A4S4LIX3_9AGAM|nr:hypothetical protein EW146_g7934 [Bondarzewia mesenterica]
MVPRRSPSDSAMKSGSLNGGYSADDPEYFVVGNSGFGLRGTVRQRWHLVGVTFDGELDSFPAQSTAGVSIPLTSLDDRLSM